LHEKVYGRNREGAFNRDSASLVCAWFKI